MSSWLKLCFICCVLFPAVCAGEIDPMASLPQPDKVINLWPDRPVVSPAHSYKTRGDNGGIIKLNNIEVPGISMYRPEGKTGVTPAVIVCPGGGYAILAWNHEGVEIAKWLNSLGITAFVLKYTVDGQREKAIQDAQRAMRMVRFHAAEWKIDAGKTGVMGFSAGGHLSARLSTGYDRPAYEPADDADKEDCRPDFTILIYPAYLGTNTSYDLPPEIPVTENTPQAFIAQSQDDKHSASAVNYYLALRRYKVPAELHMFPAGGHGYGLRSVDKPVKQWPVLCEEWLKTILK